MKLNVSLNYTFEIGNCVVTVAINIRLKINKYTKTKRRNKLSRLPRPLLMRYLQAKTYISRNRSISVYFQILFLDTSVSLIKKVKYLHVTSYLPWTTLSIFKKSFTVKRLWIFYTRKGFGMKNKNRFSLIVPYALLYTLKRCNAIKD